MAPRLMYLMRSRTLPFPFPYSRGETTVKDLQLCC